MIDRRTVLAGASAAIGVSALPFGASALTTGRRPNIVFIMADDLGYADVGCYGRREYETPHIDRLASQGARMTDAYANSPVCSATRVALMTGNYQYRLRVGLDEPLMPGSAYGLPRDVATLPELLRSAGYRTSLVGKWHLGSLPDYGPLKSGYDSFWGIRGGGVDYFTHDVAGTPDLWDGVQQIEETGYLTELLGDRAVQEIQSFPDDEPFFLSLHFTAPHWPWEGPDDEAEAARLAARGDFHSILHFDGGSMDTYAAMVTSLDEQVGRVMRALEERSLSDDTIVIFTSDNGGERFSDVWPFVGRKGQLLEGGLRVPCIVRWPSRIGARQVLDQPTATMDWMPTLLAAAGAEQPPCDGVNILPMLLGSPLAERALFWRFMNMDQEACRLGRWKYLKILGNEFLFDLAADPMERANLKDRYPDKFSELTRLFNAWNQHMLPLDPTAVTRGFMANELADHFGVDTPVTRAPPTTYPIGRQ